MMFTAAEITHLSLAEEAKQRAKVERLLAALKPFAELAGKLDGAPNLIGLLTEADFQRAASAYNGEQSGDAK